MVCAIKCAAALMLAYQSGSTSGTPPPQAASAISIAMGPAPALLAVVCIAYMLLHCLHALRRNPAAQARM